MEFEEREKKAEAKRY